MKTPYLTLQYTNTQQCAEKALKAYLSFKGCKLERTHDIGYLVEQCSEFDCDFKKLLDIAEELNPYSTYFRYPDILLEPEIDDVKDAIKKAVIILEVVESKINA